MPLPIITHHIPSIHKHKVHISAGERQIKGQVVAGDSVRMGQEGIAVCNSVHFAIFMSRNELVS